MIKDVIINITRQTQPLSSSGFGVPLILATNADAAYKEYTDLTTLAADFTSATNAYKLANAIFSQNPRPAKVAVLGKSYTPNETTPDTTALTTALDTLIQTHNDWFFLLCDLHSTNEIKALSTWAGTQKKMYFAVTVDDTLIDADTIKQDNTLLIYHDKPESYPDGALAGVVAPTTPGAITFKFKTLNGIEAVSSISDSKIAELHNHHVNTYVSKYGVLQTSEGLVTSGEYADVIRDQYYVEAQIAENVSRVLFTQPKVPYDNRGIALIASKIQNVLKSAFAKGIIAADENGVGIYSVTAPNRKDISSTNISNRILPDVNFTYTVGGAVHSITVNGVLTI